MGVLGLHDPDPVIVPLATVPLPVNSTKLPFFSPRTKSRLIVELSGTGFAGTPIRTPSPVLLALLSSPFPEIDPCPVLLLAIKQTGPCTENVPTGLATLQGLDTKDTWYVSVPLCDPRFPVTVHIPCMDVPVPIPLLVELHALTETIEAKIKIKMRFVSVSLVGHAEPPDGELEFPEIGHRLARFSVTPGIG